MGSERISFVPECADIVAGTSSNAMTEELVSVTMFRTMALGEMLD
jgi:hypothetical protein